MKKITEELNGLKYVYHDSFTVISPKSYTPTLPMSCPICNFILADSDDDIAFKQNGCCVDCTHKWFEPHRKKWLSGWRPSKEQVNKQKKERHSIPISFYLENT